MKVASNTEMLVRNINNPTTREHMGEVECGGDITWVDGRHMPVQTEASLIHVHSNTSQAKSREGWPGFGSSRGLVPEKHVRC
ncbi:hypothetical protein K443DRAFT_677526 [Laccaria amethystina LaAM-08-1]|uniref:Uncharacterized protein n=1 Tax=Laccaria amethystina LaAM-08-1 TaxID=1095629 RepID=A0A0C9WTQ8_9AGAR|nr:hypothetical protein K443DRAFT_677526 [Laccaria amethystina LaAM-08-1]